MKMIVTIITVLLISDFFYSTKSYALVAQNINDTKMNIYEDGYIRAKNRMKRRNNDDDNDNSIKAKSMSNSRSSGINTYKYNTEVANEIFGPIVPSDNSPVNITKTIEVNMDQNPETIALGVDQKMEIKLAIPEHINWNYQRMPDNLNLLREDKRNGYFILTYKGSKPGTQKLLFESILINGSDVRFLDTKNLEVTVR